MCQNTQQVGTNCEESQLVPQASLCPAFIPGTIQHTLIAHYVLHVWMVDPRCPCTAIMAQQEAPGTCSTHTPGIHPTHTCQKAATLYQQSSAPVHMWLQRMSHEATPVML
jgi:hypothetical protein